MEDVALGRSKSNKSTSAFRLPPISVKTDCSQKMLMEHTIIGQRFQLKPVSMTLAMIDTSQLAIYASCTDECQVKCVW